MPSDLKKLKNPPVFCLVVLSFHSLSVSASVSVCQDAAVDFLKNTHKSQQQKTTQLNKELKKRDCLSVDQSIHRVNNSQAVFCFEKVSVSFMISSVVLT